jgi:hypothetical protein
MALTVPCPAIPVDGPRMKRTVPVGMVSMLTMTAVPVPPIDGTIEGPARSQYVYGSTAAKRASSRIQGMDRVGSHSNDSPSRLSGTSLSRKNLPCERNMSNRQCRARGSHGRDWKVSPRKISECAKIVERYKPQGKRQKISISNPKEWVPLSSLEFQLILMVDFGGVIATYAGRPRWQVVPCRD